jgi:long-chain acyl-CoA synthetase
MKMLRQTRDLLSDCDAYIFRRTPDGDEIHKTYSRTWMILKPSGLLLLKIGLKGSIIAVLGENRYEWAVAGTAIINGVGVSVPIDKLLPAFEVESLLDRGEVDAYIFSPKFMKDAADIATRNNWIKYFICMDISMLRVINPMTRGSLTCRILFHGENRDRRRGTDLM